MKLFTAAEIKSARAKEEARDLARIEGLREALSVAQTKLNDLHDKFNADLARQRVIWAKEEEEHEKRIATLKAEIILLLKEKGVVPIESGEQNLDNVSNLLMERLDEVGEREVNVLEREKKVELREAALQKEREFIKSIYP